MAIQLHCEHCNALIQAPETAAGRRGKCPHCNGVVYIPSLPSPESDEGEIPLAPLDEEEERERLRAEAEAARLQAELLHERSVPGEPGQRRPSRSIETPAEAAARMPAKEINRLIVQYVEAMAGGHLDSAEKLVGKLLPARLNTLTALDGMMSEDLAAYGLPALPRPVLLGFLKQLRTTLQSA